MNFLFHLLNPGGTLLFSRTQISSLDKHSVEKIGFLFSTFYDSQLASNTEICICYRPIKNEILLSNHSLFQAASYDCYASDYKDDVQFISTWLKDANEVLEIGIGTGRLAMHLSKGRQCYYGIDSSASMLHILQKKTKNAQSNLYLIQQSMKNLNVNKKFDAIILPFRVMPYLESEKEILELLIKLRAHLKPTNGRILLNMINFGDDYIKKWNNKEYTEKFISPFNTEWIKKDLMHFDINKQILLREIQIISGHNILSKSQDNLFWLCSDKMLTLCEQANLVVENIWPAYRFSPYQGEWEYLISLTV